MHHVSKLIIPYLCERLGALSIVRAARGRFPSRAKPQSKAVNWRQKRGAAGKVLLRVQVSPPVSWCAIIRYHSRKKKNMCGYACESQKETRFNPWVCVSHHKANTDGLKHPADWCCTATHLYVRKTDQAKNHPRRPIMSNCVTLVPSTTYSMLLYEYEQT